MLTQEENKRYSRHILLSEVGSIGQEKLKASRVLVIGAGGLGCPILQYLTAAGVGTIGILDFDVVSLSNLQRQILYSVEEVGQSKAIAAGRRLTLLNPNVNFQLHDVELTSENAVTIFGDYDIIVDGSDNFQTRYLVNDACIVLDKPLVFGSIYTFQGQISVFNYENGPSYRCLFPEPPAPGSVKNCSEIGVIGVLPGIIGAQQANEVIKMILGVGEVLSGILLVYDAKQSTYNRLRVSRNEQAIQEVRDRKKTFTEFDYDFFCGIEPAKEKLEGQVSGQELKKEIGSESVQIVDVRELWEEPVLEGENVLKIPMGEILEKIDQLSREKRIILVCQSGMRSNQVKLLLENQYDFRDIWELKGGMNQYE